MTGGPITRPHNGESQGGQGGLPIRVQELRRVRAGDLLPDPRNWRKHPPAQQKAMRAALAEIGYADVLLARETPEGLRLIDGHLRAELDPEQQVPVAILDLDEAEAGKLLVTLDPLAGLAETDTEALRDLVGSLTFDQPDLGEWVDSLGLPSSSPHGSLAEEFIAPPFTVLDGRSGWWQNRKRLWLSRGIKSELGRRVGTYHNKWTRDNTDITVGGDDDGDYSSVFDPVLCELVYRWFMPAGGQVVDPFAGGSARGFVAHALGYRYWGCDLSEAQVMANREQAEGPDWVVGDAMTCLGDAPEADCVFTCPPYADLEVYSQDARDLSCMGHAEFVAAYHSIIAAAAELLRPDSFAAVVIGDARAEDGTYYGLVGETVEAFSHAGLGLYNQAVYLTPLGNLQIRAARPFRGSRKLGMAHQHLLVFLKGDATRAAMRCGPIEVCEP